MIPLLIVALGGLALLLYKTNAFASVFPAEWQGAGLDVGEVYGMKDGLTGTFLGSTEDSRILNAAESRGVDARFLAAIRKAEMGGPGREFGIISIPAPTYEDQVRIAANTIGNNVGRYEQDKGYAARVDGRYTDEFIRYIGGVWAPIGASNDPTGLNQNWVNNVSAWYGRIDYA